MTRSGATRSGATRATVITLASTPRLAHVRNQVSALRKPRTNIYIDIDIDIDINIVLVWLGENAPPQLDVDHTLHIPPGALGLRLAAARNAGADLAVAAGAHVLIFLDADCVPGPSLVDGYVAAAAEHPQAVLCGPVTYLEPGVDVGDAAALTAATRPHSARPSPPPGQVLQATAEQYSLFWSLSFAVAASAWCSMPRFDEGYEGYGGEDTDFAFGLRACGVPLAWVGGAHAYHQHHPTSSPPWQHLDDIIRNGRRFAERWGEWPMTGWLEAFEREGAVHHEGEGWARV